MFPKHTNIGVEHVYFLWYGVWVRVSLGQGLEYTDYIPCWGVGPLHPKYDLLGMTTASDDKVPFLELWRMWNISWLPLLPVPLWAGVLVPFRVPSMGQIDLLHNYSYSIGLWVKWKKKTLKNTSNEHISRDIE